MPRSTDEYDELYKKANEEFDKIFKPKGLDHYETKIKLNPKDVQIGGDHYKKYKIQPIEFAQLNNLDACQFSILKYILRHRDKDGVKDLNKAIHMIELYKEFVYGV